MGHISSEMGGKQADKEPGKGEGVMNQCGKCQGRELGSC